MADVKDWDFGVVTQGFNIGQQFGFARLVQRCEGFVHQQKCGLRQQSASDGDAGFLAARQRTGAAIEQAGQAEQVDDVVKIWASIVQITGMAREPAAIAQVLPHIQVREQAGVLENIAKAAAVGGLVYSGCCVEKDGIP